MHYYNSSARVSFDASEAMKLGWEEFKGILNLKAYWFSFITIGLVISFTGSFDTYYIYPLENRIAFVIPFLLISGLCCAVLASIHRALTGISCLKRFDVVVKIAFLWVLIATIPARFIINYLGDVPLTATQIIRSVVHGSSIALLITIIMYVIAQRKRAAKRKQDAIDAETPPIESPKGTDAVPDSHVRLPYYIESEDHYLKMVYLGKVEYIRANLGEVAAGFACRGLRCHKSYWVARTAIERRRREGRQLLLVLKDGTEIPVGRSFEKGVRTLLDNELRFQVAS